MSWDDEGEVESMKQPILKTKHRSVGPRKGIGNGVIVKVRRARRKKSQQQRRNDRSLDKAEYQEIGTRLEIGDKE